MRKNAIVTIGSIYLTAALVAACASKPTESKNETPAAESKTTAPSATDVRDRYSISQLEAASNALKVIADSAKDPKQDTGTEIIGCALTAGRASAMRSSMRNLIDGKIAGESEAYSVAPSQYGDSNSFETCAASCSCGALNEVIRGARTTAFKRNDTKYHDRWMARLKLKASTLGERELRSCAMKQNWICGSDLMKYLEAQASGIQ